MALTYSEISAITQKKFIPKLYDNIFDSNPLLQRLKKKSYEKLDGGERIIVPLNYAKTGSSGWYAGSDTLSTTELEVMTAAEYTWKQLYTNVSIARSDELKNSGDSQILGLVKQKISVAEKSMLDLLGTGIYSDGTSVAKSIIGLQAMISTSTVVGSIDQSAFSWWQAKVDSTTITLSIAAMQAIFNKVQVNNDKPTVIATTRSIYNSYYALLQPQQRFMDDETAKGGFASLMFNQAPVIPDSYAPANKMYMLNENYLHLFVHKDEDMRFEPFQKPVNQNVKVAKIYWFGAFGASNNRLQGGLTAITA